MKIGDKVRCIDKKNYNPSGEQFFGIRFLQLNKIYTIFDLQYDEICLNEIPDYVYILERFEIVPLREIRKNKLNNIYEEKFEERR